MTRALYRGRFAPSPTGPLHLGSLLTAVASYVDARAHHGIWLVRIEDIDPPRAVAGTDRLILETLMAHGLRWDDTVLFQSTRYAQYEQVIERLLKSGHAYYCCCSRLELDPDGSHAVDCPRSRLPPTRPAAVRVAAPDVPSRFTDIFRGDTPTNPQASSGDYVVRRKDGLYAYQLAVVVDDAFQGITDVIRGLDLLDSTPRQLHLQNLLGLQSPDYGHVPLVVNDSGQKLSKQNLAAPVCNDAAQRNLLHCLRCLGQETPPTGHNADCDSLLAWGVEHWDRRRIPDAEHLRETAVASLGLFQST